MKLYCVGRVNLEFFTCSSLTTGNLKLSGALRKKSNMDQLLLIQQNSCEDVTIQEKALIRAWILFFFIQLIAWGN